MKTRIKYNKNKHQREFDQDLKTFQVFLSSGFGGGKSYALVMKHLKLHWLNKGYPTGLFAPSVPEYKRDVLPQLYDILLENDIQFKYVKQDREWYFPFNPRPMIVFTCEARIRGPNLACASINEPGLILKERYDEILGRVRIKGAPYPQINLAGTWEGKANWLYERFYEYEGKDRKVIFGNTKDNAHNLREGYIEDLYANYDEQLAKAYIEGLPVSLTNRAFYYAFSRERNTDKALKRIPGLHCHIGMDFNVDFGTCTIWHVFDDEAHAFDEIMIPKNASTQKMCDALKARKYNPRDCTVYPDTAGKARDTRGNITDMAILENNGYSVRFKPRAPYFRDRQLNVCNLLDKGKLKINPTTCPTLLRDLEDVEQAVSDYSKIKDNPKLSHASDGMDYMIDIKFPLSGSKPMTMTPR